MSLWTLLGYTTRTKSIRDAAKGDKNNHAVFGGNTNMRTRLSSVFQL